MLAGLARTLSRDVEVFAAGTLDSLGKLANDVLKPLGSCKVPGTDALKAQVAIITGASGHREGRGLAAGGRGPAWLSSRAVARRPKGRPGAAGPFFPVAAPRRFLAYACDVSSSKEVVAVVETVLKELGRIDILVQQCGNHAGQPPLSA